MEQLKTVLVTGSTGLIGSHLVKALSAEKRYRVIGAVEDDSGYTDRYVANDYLRTIPNAALLKGQLSDVDLVVNCAFARSNDPRLLADALDFTANLALSLKKIGVGALINISSQGVYKRLPEGQLQTEDSEIEPIDLYSMSKYAAERLLIASNCAAHITNVRLASINMRQRFLFAFVRKVLSGEPIVLTAPHQNAALLDVKDAVAGLMALIELPDAERKETYNLGIGSQMTILDYARVAEKTLKEFGYSAKMTVLDQNTDLRNSGMDCSRIMRDTGWAPEVSAYDMVRSFCQDIMGGKS